MEPRRCVRFLADARALISRQRNIEASLQILGLVEFAGEAKRGCMDLLNKEAKMKRGLVVLLSSFAMLLTATGALYAGQASGAASFLASDPRVSQDGSVGRSCVLSTSNGLKANLGLPETAREIQPIPAAPPQGCTYWGICSITCGVGCTYNWECPPVDGEPQYCNCTGICE